MGHNPLKHQIVVAFKGTNPKNVANWLTDLSFTLTPYLPANNSNILVHEGFYKSYLSMRSQMVTHVKKLASAYPSYDLVVTGHSLGGANAALAALELRTILPKRTMDIITYGQPRIGTASLMTWATKHLRGVRSHWRLVHNRDPVPHAPPAWLNYRHMGTEVYYNNAMTSFQVCDGSGEDHNCSDGNSLNVNIFNHISYFGVSVGTDC